MRVLVGKVFTGTGSKFEIHTPTAVAAARGTYFIVWLFEQGGNPVTGVLSLADRVDVGNMDAAILGTVRLGPNQYTIVAKGKPPTAAAMMDPALLAELLSSTELPEVWLEAIPAPTVLPGGVEEVRPPGIKQPEAPVRLPAEEGGVPPVPPIPQQPGGTTPVNVEIRFP